MITAGLTRCGILAHMVAVLKAERDHLDLETDAPFPVESIPFEEALAQVESWT